MKQTFEFKHIGFLEGHSDWVTAIVTNQDQAQSGDLVISGSRDKSIIIWKLLKSGESDKAGQPRKMLKGHSHFVSDLALSNENKVLLSSSWDRELRYWDLTTGSCEVRFTGNAKELFTVALSPDNRYICAGGAEKKIQLYNIHGVLRHSQDKHFHTDWISQIRFSPFIKSLNPYFVSVGWDGWLKIWNQNWTIRYQFKAHESQINAVTINPNGELIATGGKDKKVYLWNITDLKKPAFEYDAGGIVNALAFHPQQNWIAAATENGIRIWAISAEDKGELKVPIVTLDHHEEIIIQKKQEGDSKKIATHGCTSLAFDAIGAKLYGGFTDGKILVWEVTQRN